MDMSPLPKFPPFYQQQQKHNDNIYTLMPTPPLHPVIFSMLHWLFWIFFFFKKKKNSESEMSLSLACDVDGQNLRKKKGKKKRMDQRGKLCICGLWGPPTRAFCTHIPKAKGHWKIIIIKKKKRNDECLNDGHTMRIASFLYIILFFFRDFLITLFFLLGTTFFSLRVQYHFFLG